VPVQNLPTRVTYIARADGGVSHFKLVRDNLRISLMHSRLMTSMITRRVLTWLAPAWLRRLMSGRRKQQLAAATPEQKQA
jgi:hypothetical protein